MDNDSTKNQLDVSEIGEITNQLQEGRLSRRGLSDSLKGLGLGFGAAFVLGMTGAQAATAPDSNVVLKSRNPVKPPPMINSSNWLGSTVSSAASSIAGIAAGNRLSRARHVTKTRTKRPGGNSGAFSILSAQSRSAAQSWQQSASAR